MKNYFTLAMCAFFASCGGVAKGETVATHTLDEQRYREGKGLVPENIMPI